MDKLNQIVKRCKASIDIQINQHKDFYQTSGDYFNESYDDGHKDVSEEVMKKMLDLDTVVRIQAYPDTPVGCYIVYSYDLDLAIEEMHNLIFNQ